MMDNYSSKDGLDQTSSDDDSDVDLVTDYTTKLDSSTSSIKNYFISTENLKQKKSMICNDSVYSNGATKNLSNNQSGAWNNNLTSITSQSKNISNLKMLPIISVTPHSPGAKYNSILEDSLCHLQSIRETVQQMKNSTAKNTSFANVVAANSTLVSSKNYYSCPSLSNDSASRSIWLAAQNATTYTLSDNRRKSWTAIEDLGDCTKNSHKSSVSLTSLDSEEQESLRAHERLHNRTNRNSTGGISTHSLNEAELVRDFEKLAAKRSLAPSICRLPLQKSISTPSIAQVQNSKEENNVPEVFTGEKKRRKRGSLFSRKKKDKAKPKGQFTNCDACGIAIEIASYREHAVECNLKLTKHSKSPSGKKHSFNSHESRDYYEHAQNDNSNFSDDTPLIRDEFFTSEALVGPHDLGAEHILGVAIDEYDSWSPSVPKEVVKSLKDKQVKRQEHIYEFLMTEKHHCQTLLVMQKVFVDSLQRHFNNLNLERMFPRLHELTELHLGLLKKLRLKQKENYVIDSVADILVDFFSSVSAQKLKNAYGEFCSNHRSALNTFKWYMTEDQKFSEWYKHCLQNPLLKKKGIPECILFVTQRLTKYPLLIQPLLKSSVDDKVEHEKLIKAMHLVKDILVDVDSRVAEKDKEDRQLEIFKRIDAKSHAVLKLIDEKSDLNETIIKEIKFKKSDVISSNRKFKFEGVATLMQGGRAKIQTVLVVVLSDCLFFLLDNSNKYSFFNPENKAGVVTLQKLLIRAKADSRGNTSDSRGIYIISSNQANPEMYELKVQNPKDKNVWIQAIRAAVVDCPTDDSNRDDHITADQRQKLMDEKQANIRDLIGKMRQKDFEQAIVLEEKIALHLELLLDRQKAYSAEQLSPGVNAFLSSFGTYRDLVLDESDPIEIWKRTLIAVQDISQLASSLYTAATGLPLSRSFSSMGDRQSELFMAPTLPKRAETFGGFDERRNKTTCVMPSRDAVLTTLSPGYFSNRDKSEKRESNDVSELDSVSCYGSSNTNLDDSNNDTLKDNNYAALQVSHNLHTLLCIISQQMTTIQSLQGQLNNFRDNPKTMYRHNDQLEELRNLQDRLQEEKTSWLKMKEQQEREIEEDRKKLKILQDLIKKDQQDIQNQREQLYRKMEILSNQGLLISPNVSIPVNPVTANLVSSEIDGQCSIISSDDNTFDSNASERRKERWKPAPASKPLALNVGTASPKVAATMRQQLPLKLSSLSSAKAPTSVNTSTSPSVAQLFPLKLADKRNANITPSHSRTGSSPAIIQQPFDLQQQGNPATRTNTYPKIPERYRLRSTDGTKSKASVVGTQEQISSIPNKARSASLHGQLPQKISPDNHSNNNNHCKSQNSNDEKATQKEEEEVLYF